MLDLYHLEDEMVSLVRDLRQARHSRADRAAAPPSYSIPVRRSPPRASLSPPRLDSMRVSAGDTLVAAAGGPLRSHRCGAMSGADRAAGSLSFVPTPRAPPPSSVAPIPFSTPSAHAFGGVADARSISSPTAPPTAVIHHAHAPPPLVLPSPTLGHTRWEGALPPSEQPTCRLHDEGAPLSPAPRQGRPPPASLPLRSPALSPVGLASLSRNERLEAESLLASASSRRHAEPYATAPLPTPLTANTAGFSLHSHPSSAHACAGIGWTPMTPGRGSHNWQDAWHPALDPSLEHGAAMQKARRHRQRVATRRWHRAAVDRVGRTKMQLAARAIGHRLASHRSLRRWLVTVGSRESREVKDLHAICTWRLEALLQGRADPIRLSRSTVSKWWLNLAVAAFNAWRQWLLESIIRRDTLVHTFLPAHVRHIRRGALSQWKYSMWVDVGVRLATWRARQRTELLRRTVHSFRRNASWTKFWTTSRQTATIRWLRSTCRNAMLRWRVWLLPITPILSTWKLAAATRLLRQWKLIRLDARAQIQRDAIAVTLSYRTRVSSAWRNWALLSVVHNQAQRVITRALRLGHQKALFAAVRRLDAIRRRRWLLRRVEALGMQSRLRRWLCFWRTICKCCTRNAVMSEVLSTKLVEVEILNAFLLIQQWAVRAHELQRIAACTATITLGRLREKLDAWLEYSLFRRTCRRVSSARARRSFALAFNRWNKASARALHVARMHRDSQHVQMAAFVSILRRRLVSSRAFGDQEDAALKACARWRSREALSAWAQHSAARSETAAQNQSLVHRIHRTKLKHSVRIWRRDWDGRHNIADAATSIVFKMCRRTIRAWSKRSADRIRLVQLEEDASRRYTLTTGTRWLSRLSNCAKDLQQQLGKKKQIQLILQSFQYEVLSRLRSKGMVAWKLLVSKAIADESLVTRACEWAHVHVSGIALLRWRALARQACNLRQWTMLFQRKRIIRSQSRWIDLMKVRTENKRFSKVALDHAGQRQAKRSLAALDKLRKLVQEGLEASKRSLAWNRHQVTKSYHSWLINVAQLKLRIIMLRKAKKQWLKNSFSMLKLASEMEATRRKATIVAGTQKRKRISALRLAFQSWADRHSDGLLERTLDQLASRLFVASSFRRLNRSCRRASLNDVHSDKAIAAYVESAMRRVFKRCRRLYCRPNGWWRLRSVADHWMQLKAFKHGLQRWQLHCWRVLCNHCAVQHNARKLLLPILNAWKAYIKLLTDLFRRQTNTAIAMSNAVLLNTVFHSWFSLVHFRRAYAPPPNSHAWEQELPVWQRLTLQHAEHAREEAERRLRLEAERAQRIKTEAWQRHQLESRRIREASLSALHQRESQLEHIRNQAEAELARVRAVEAGAARPYGSVGTTPGATATPAPLNQMPMPASAFRPNSHTRSNMMPNFHLEPGFSGTPAVSSAPHFSTAKMDYPSERVLKYESAYTGPHFESGLHTASNPRLDSYGSSYESSLREALDRSALERRIEGLSASLRQMIPPQEVLRPALATPYASKPLELDSLGGAYTFRPTPGWKYSHFDSGPQLSDTNFNAGSHARTNNGRTLIPELEPEARDLRALPGTDRISRSGTSDAASHPPHVEEHKKSLRELSRATHQLSRDR